MNLVCRLFGHKPPSESSTVGGEYGSIRYSVVDGIGRQHAELYGECPRCGKEYRVMRTHVRREHE